MSKTALIIFVKNPRLGAVKTRLAASIGDAAALRVYLELVAHTRQVSRDSGLPVHLFYHEEIVDHDDWNHPSITKHLQHSGDLGQRMKAAFETVLGSGFQSAIIIGSDCYALSASHIKRAKRKLEEFDSVIGPAFDGGYYLLGLTGTLPKIFNGISWSTASVLQETISRLEEEGLTKFLVEPLSDIDELADLERHPELVKLINSN